MKLHKILVIIFCLSVSFLSAQKDSLAIKSFKDFPKEKLQTDEMGNLYYYDEAQKARIYNIEGEKVVVLDELVLLPKPHFNNQQDRNYYYFLNKKLNRVYPYFITALEQYRDLHEELQNVKDNKRRAYVRAKQDVLATQYESQLRDLTTTEGKIFAKLMHRATGKTVFEIIKELRGGWSAFWWNIKGKIADIDLKDPYDPYTNRQDNFVESLLQSNWHLGYLQPYEGYQNFKTKK